MTMPLFDSLKKLFGIPDSRPQSSAPNDQHLDSIDQHLDSVDRQTLNVDDPPNNERTLRLHLNFDSDWFFEEEGIKQLENLLRNLPPFGFSFGFGSPGPFQPPVPNHDPDPFGGSPVPDSGMFPAFHGFFQMFGPEEFFPSDAGPGGFHRGVFGPAVEDITRGEDSSPRDEVLKPSYRSSVPQIRDEDYDDLVKERGPDVILDILKKSEEAEQNKDRQLVPALRPDIAPGSMFSSTKFSFVNGKSVKEQITSLPDGTFEKRVTTTGPDGETNTVVSQLAAEDVMPQTGGFGGGLFGRGGGFGGSPFW